jgi:hypothetical protein
MTLQLSRRLSDHRRKLRVGKDPTKARGTIFHISALHQAAARVAVKHRLDIRLLMLVPTKLEAHDWTLVFIGKSKLGIDDRRGPAYERHYDVGVLDCVIHCFEEAR